MKNLSGKLLFAFALFVCFGRSEAVQQHKRHRAHLSASHPNLATIRRYEKARQNEWKRNYEGIHPRVTLQNLKIDPVSRKLVVRVKTYLPADDLDATIGAIKFYLDGKFQEKSFGSNGRLDKTFVSFFDLHSLEPLVSGKTYLLEVIDRDSGDRQKWKIVLRGGKIVRLR